ncbi:MAG: molybdopterin molybdotransferase MoeA [Rhizobiaceae bacterium]
MKQLIPVDEAVRMVLADAPVLPAEDAVLREASYRVLADDIVAKRTQPPFPAAAMDGYAVADDDAHKGSVLTLIGESAAGRGFNGNVRSGECVRIFTGAPVPPGAGTVVMQEDVSVVEAGVIRIDQEIVVGRHVRGVGLDFAEGRLLLAKGTLLDAASLSLVAAGGHARLPVVKRPLVAIIATGDELVSPGEAAGPDQIVASNSFGIAALARRAGADILDLGIVRDDKALISAAISKAFDSGADILVTLGGASVGDHDLIKPVLADFGIGLGFWQIAMRPGKPLMHGRHGAAHVLGLPGNPVSSMVCAHLFLLPLIAQLSGTVYAHRFVQAKLQTAMAPNDKRQDYVRAQISFDSDGVAAAKPFGIQDSSMLSVLAASNGLIVREPHAIAANIGDEVTVLMLR